MTRTKPILVVVMTLLAGSAAYAQSPPGHPGAEQVKLEIAALLAAALYMLVDVVVKPAFKKIGFDITANFKAFQPLLLAVSSGLAAIICQTGICDRIGAISTNGTSVTHDPIAWLLYSLLGWAGSQILHNMMPGTNTKTSTSGEGKTG